MQISSPLLATGSLPQSQGTGRERLAQAARQFEAIFVRQVLAEARKSHFGGGLFDEGNPDSAIGTFNRMQDEHVADLAAERGAFGLAKMIEAQLSAQLSPLPPAGGVGGGPVIQPAPTAPPLAPPASGRGTVDFGSKREGKS
jgi:peptidoglycan hydrolase FlgJ